MGRLTQNEIIAQLREQAARDKLQSIVAAAQINKDGTVSDPDERRKYSDTIRRAYDDLWSVPLVTELTDLLRDVIEPVLQESAPELLKGGGQALTAAAFGSDEEIARRFGVTVADMNRARKEREELERRQAREGRRKLSESQTKRLKGTGEINLKSPRCLNETQRGVIRERLAEHIGAIDYDTEGVIYDSIGASLRAAGLYDESQFSLYAIDPPERIQIPRKFLEASREEIEEAVGKKLEKLSERELRAAKRLYEAHQKTFREERDRLQKLIDDDRFVTTNEKREALKLLDEANSQLPGYISTARQAEYKTQLERYEERVSKVGRDQAGSRPIPPTPVTAEDWLEHFQKKVGDITEEQAEKEITKKERALAELDKKRQADWRSLNRRFGGTYTTDGSILLEPSTRRIRYLKGRRPEGVSYPEFYSDNTIYHRFPPAGGYLEPIEAVVERFLDPNTPLSVYKQDKSTLYNFLFEYTWADDTGKLLQNKSFLRALRTPREIKFATEDAKSVDRKKVVNNTISLKNVKNIQAKTRKRAEGILQSYLFDSVEKQLCQGVPFEDVMRRLERDMKGFASDIASTASNEALNQMAVNLGGLKEWNATYYNTRPDHAAADGQVVDADEKFRVGGELANAPHDPSLSVAQRRNCLCSISVIVETPDNETHYLSVTDRFKRTPKPPKKKR